LHKIKKISFIADKLLIFVYSNYYNFTYINMHQFNISRTFSLDLLRVCHQRPHPTSVL